MIRILVCDDERDIVSALAIFLGGQGYDVVRAYDGDEAVRMVLRGGISLCLLDIMMPGKDGITALTEIRQMSNIPVIMLTAKSEDGDKILGLDLGADDYITKPFNPSEVIARVRSQLRRYIQLGGGAADPDVLRVGGLELNIARREVTIDGEPVTLTPTEYDIMRLFFEHPGQVFSLKDIYRRVWGDSYGDERTVAVHIRHLREKLEIDPSAPRYLTVVWGQGYKLADK